MVGFTLQYEMSYSNILAMLKLGGIPLHTAERTDADPIVCVGGPCAFNPEPLADFVDAVMIGDGEEMIVEFIAAVREWKKSGEPREACLRRLAKIPGVYVPSFYEVSYHEDGTIAAFTPKCPEGTGHGAQAAGAGHGQGLLSHGDSRAIYGDRP